METSSSFTALETMLQQGWFLLQFPEFKNLLDKLEKTNVISSTEHQVLLELAKQLCLEKLDQDD